MDVDGWMLCSSDWYFQITHPWRDDHCVTDCLWRTSRFNLLLPLYAHCCQSQTYYRIEESKKKLLLSFFPIPSHPPVEHSYSTDRQTAGLPHNNYCCAITLVWRWLLLVLVQTRFSRGIDTWLVFILPSRPYFFLLLYYLISFSTFLLQKSLAVAAMNSIVSFRFIVCIKPSRSSAESGGS